MLTLPDLNRVRVFHEVYTARSLVGAAQALGTTRSAVSQSLKALERELNTKLFFRDSKKVLPTAPAEVLFRATEPLLAGLRVAIETIETGRTQASGLLRI